MRKLRPAKNDRDAAGLSSLANSAWLELLKSVPATIKRVAGHWRAHYLDIVTLRRSCGFVLQPGLRLHPGRLLRFSL